MEVKIKDQKSHPEKIRDEKIESNAWLNLEHPNFERWKRARDLAVERGKFVKSIIEKYSACKDLTILDLGSGEGGTSVVFSEENQVFGYDLNLSRLDRQKNNSANYYRINGDALKLSFRDNSFNLIILQDVIEHLNNNSLLISEIVRVLKPEGLVYISTPNKYSVFNFVADPHWGVPVVSILKRESIRKHFLKYFRKDEINRKDIPELLSMNEIYKNFGKYFQINIETRHSVERLINGDKGLVWSNFHLKIIKLIRRIKAEKILVFMANNKKGIINKYFNPTFYLTARKIK